MENQTNTYLPTYEECVAIAIKHDNFTFYESKFILEGYPVSLFNYRLNPEFVDRGSLEMRGIAFVFNKDNTLYKRFLLIKKFWNLNQKEETFLNKLESLPIKTISVKEDGSLASFIQLPNGAVYGKSKMSFESDQAVNIQLIYDENADLKRFVNFCMNNDIVPVFEYTSPENFVVVTYTKPQLTLIKMRCNKTGIYLDMSNYADHLVGINVVDNETYKGWTLDQLLVEGKNVEEMEGWVIEFDKFMVKIKGDWYYTRHSLYFRELIQENIVMRMILNDTIDDVLAILPEDDVKRVEIETMTNLINDYIHESVGLIKDYMATYDGDMKKFAANNIKNEWFKILSRLIRRGEGYTDDNIIDSIKAKMVNDYFRFKKAKNFIDALKAKSQL